MTTERLEVFPIKTTLVAADIIYAADSANSFDEVQVAFSNVPGNNTLNPNTSYSTATLAIYDPVNSSHFTSGTMSLSGTLLTIVGGTLSSSLIGAIVVWADGNLSMIDAVLSSTTATVKPSTTSSESSQTTNIYTGLAYFLQDSNTNIGWTGIPLFILNSNVMTLWSGTNSSQKAILDLSAIVSSGNGGGTYQFQDLSGGTMQIAVTGNQAVASGSPTIVRYVTYYPNSASLITLNMPATVNQGDLFIVQGIGSGGWAIQLATGQTAYLTSVIHTSTSRNIASTDQYNSITLKALSSTTFGVVAFNGTFTWT